MLLQKQQLHRPGVLQERSVAPEAAVAAPKSFAGAFVGSRFFSFFLLRLSIASANSKIASWEALGGRIP